MHIFYCAGGQQRQTLKLGPMSATQEGIFCLCVEVFDTHTVAILLEKGSSIVCIG